MLSVIIGATACLLGVGDQPYLGAAYQGRAVGAILLADVGYGPVAGVDDVHRPGFNGLVWRSIPVIGGTGPTNVLQWGDPGPAAYGAAGAGGERVFVRVGTQTIAISPWVSIPSQGLARLEAARVEWLKREGYVGGVRTFVNDAYSVKAGSMAAITPSATIRLPIDTPRFRKRQQVMKLEAGDRISLPPTASVAMRDWAASRSRAVASR